MLKSSSELSWKALNEMEAHNEIRKFFLFWDLRTKVQENALDWQVNLMNFEKFMSCKNF
jgi:hypothetical protein